jgi:arylsulfatase A
MTSIFPSVVKLLLSVLVVWSISIGVTLADTPSTPAKPNIIFILADDLGIGSESCYGADHFKTPNVDALAKSGMKFEHCYSAPLCGPARALVMTGRYAFRTGMLTNVSGDFLKPSKEVMMPRMLKPAGYVTGMCGKWNQLPLQPSDWGFDEYLRFYGSGKYWNTQSDNKYYTLNGKQVALRNGEYLPDRMHEFLVDFLTRHKNQPFYFYYAMSHVHEPILPTPDTKPGTTDDFQLYQDNVAYMDKLLGKLLGELDQLKLRQNTLIVFVGDNGTWGKFYKRVTIGGRYLSGCKGTMLEGGALVPCIVSWPGKVPAGLDTQGLINICDFYPTLASLAGAALPTGLTIDGVNFAPQLLGQSETWPRDWIFVELARNWYDREKGWKLNQDKELFNMSQAPFAEPMVPPNTQDPAAIAARNHLQAILDQLNPAGGIMDPYTPAQEAELFKKQKKTYDKAGKNPGNLNEVDQ